MSFGRNRLTVLVLWALGCSLAEADQPSVVWENTKITLTPAEGARTVAGEYRFINVSQKTLAMKSITPSCDCLRAVSDKQEYGKGETGVIRVDYALSGAEQSTSRTVKVDFGTAGGSHDLKAVLDMREPVRVAPRTVQWRIGEPAQAKRFTVSISDPAKVWLKSVQCVDSLFEVTLVPSEQPQVFYIDAKPVSTAQLAQATIRLNTQVGSKPLVLVMTAGIR